MFPKDVIERTIGLWQNAYEDKIEIVPGIFYNGGYAGHIGLHDLIGIAVSFYM